MSDSISLVLSEDPNELNMVHQILFYSEAVNTGSGNKTVISTH